MQVPLTVAGQTTQVGYRFGLVSMDITYNILRVLIYQKQDMESSKHVTK